MSDPAPRKRGSGVAQVYDVLRNEILDLKLAPGAPVDEAQLARRFDMSRTPIREALVRLTADGLVENLPNRSTIVAPIDFFNLPNFFDALTLLYRLTTRQAAARCTAKDLAPVRAHQKEFVRAVRARDSVGMILANRNFHVEIARIGGNPYFIEMFTRVLDEGRRILRLYYSSYDDTLPARYVEEHDDIIAALLANDVERADELALAHADQIVIQIQNFIAADRRVVGRVAL
ncbi:GntR family transcriptional regulator [Pelagibacterium sediminicola]|uniref:GntR family transcriptional regulator n=1 Tax=Pelagibacterium sediminicola TaxID=2248761 RepID=UPI000E31C621|nr:GntR family transcriptional regulator [Pelagibacterium sediminicola]